MTQSSTSSLDALTKSLARHGVGEARLALVLGSGLGRFADRLDSARAIPYAELDGMPQSAVPGHAGRLVLGEVDGVPVVVQQGRVHLYEGWSALEVTRAVRAFARLEVSGLILTNAAGGLEEDWKLKLPEFPEVISKSTFKVRHETCGGTYQSEGAPPRPERTIFCAAALGGPARI